MMLILGMMASLVLFAFGWLLGYGSGYTLGEAHGRETGRAELPLTREPRTSLNVPATAHDEWIRLNSPQWS